jgi:dephospho-CoA kinase
VKSPDTIFVVVLTGGIASGKTAVSDLFAEKGVPIVDTDLIARKVVQAGSPALQKIAREFGPHFLDEERNLNRRKMREAIFSDPEKKRRLEGILHPAIAAEAVRQVSMRREPWCILVVPLLAESGRYQWVNRVLVVDVDESTQIERVMARDNIDRSQAEAILRSQASRQDRLALADDIIDNSGSLDQLKSKVDSLYEIYSDLANQHQISLDAGLD